MSENSQSGWSKLPKWLRLIVYIGLVIFGVKLTQKEIEDLRLKHATNSIFGQPSPSPERGRPPGPMATPCATPDRSDPNSEDLPCNPDYKPPYDPNQPQPEPSRRKRPPNADITSTFWNSNAFSKGFFIGHGKPNEPVDGGVYESSENPSGYFFSGTYDGANLILTMYCIQMEVEMSNGEKRLETNSARSVDNRWLCGQVKAKISNDYNTMDGWFIRRLKLSYQNVNGQIQEVPQWSEWENFKADVIWN